MDITFNIKWAQRENVLYVTIFNIKEEDIKVSDTQLQIKEWKATYSEQVIPEKIGFRQNNDKSISMQIPKKDTNKPFWPTIFTENYKFVKPDWSIWEDQGDKERFFNGDLAKYIHQEIDLTMQPMK